MSEPLFTPAKRAEIADDIWRWLEANSLTEDVFVYANGLKRSRKGVERGLASHVTQYGNDASVTMTFEGDLYELVNYGTVCGIPVPAMAEGFEAIFKRHHCYYELGHAWDLTVYAD